MISLKSAKLAIIPFLFLSLGCFAQEGRVLQWKSDIDYMNRRLEIMHPDLYANIQKTDYCAEVDDLYQKLEGLNDAEIVLHIMRLLSLFRDGHTELSLVSSQPQVMNDLFHLYPYILYPFEDGVYVLSTLKKQSKALGARVLKIGNIDVENCQERLFDYISADNTQGKLSQIPYLYFNNAELLKHIGANDNTSGISLQLMDSEGLIYTVDFEAEPIFNIVSNLYRGYFPGSGKKVATMNQKANRPVPLYLSFNTNKSSAFPYFTDYYWYKALPDEKAIYIQLNVNVQKEKQSFNEFTDKVFSDYDNGDYDILIIDLRQNNGGDHIEGPLLQGILERPEINAPGKLFILTSRFTFSAAQHLVNVFSKFTNATIVGEATSGKPNFFGAVNRFSLPGHQGIVISVSTKYWQDSDPLDFRLSTPPDLHIPLLSTDYKNNIDPVTNAVFKYDKYVEKEKSLLRELKDNYLENGISGLKSYYINIKEDYRNTGINLEKMLYRNLDSWLSEHKKSRDEYIEFLRFLHAEFPESQVIMTDLASWLAKYGTKEQAKSLYLKCLKINPSNTYARMKLRLMELDETYK